MPVRYDDILVRSDEIVQTGFPIGARSDPNITTRVCVCVHVRADAFLCITIRSLQTDVLYCDWAWYRWRFCSINMEVDLRLDPERYIYIALIIILTYHNRTQPNMVFVPSKIESHHYD